MIDPLQPVLPLDAAPTLATPHLFAWRGGGIVLLGEREGERWVVARGWPQGDRFAHVRRWSFAEAGAFVRQIRRLAWEATGDASLARRAGAAAAAWSEAD